MDNNHQLLDHFCGSKFWNESLTWKTENPDLTKCFQKTILAWMPCFFLWAFAFSDVRFIRRSRKRTFQGSWMFYTKFVFTVILIARVCCDLIKAVRDSFHVEIFNVDFVTPLIQIITFNLALLLLCTNKKYGVWSSGLLFLFWLLQVICGIVPFRSIFIRNIDKTSYEFVSYCIHYAATIAVFFVNCFADVEPQISEKLLVTKPCPEQTSSFLSQLTFSWFTPLVWEGAKKPITNLWWIGQENSCKKVVPRFEKYWLTCVEKMKTIPHAKVIFRKFSGQIKINHFKPNKDELSILWPLCRAFGWTFAFAEVLKFLVDIVQFLNPKILKLLLDFTSNDEPVWRGYIYGLAFLVIGLTQNILLSRHDYLVFLVALRFQTALVATMYKKSLRLSNAARKEFTVGKIVTLITVDCQKFVENIFVNTVWSAPIQVGLALYFLSGILGPYPTLASLAVMITMLILNTYLVEKSRILQKQQMKFKDKRMKLINETMSGIKVIKLFAWEESFEKQIVAYRDEEIKALKKAAYLHAGIMFVAFCTPFFVSLAAFATFILTDENNVLDSSKAFVSLSYINIMRNPFFMFPRTVLNLIELSVSVKRINKFLNSEELDSNNAHHDVTEKYPIAAENASFAWDSSKIKLPTLRNISIKIKPGQVVAIVGNVGSGKSSLIHAILGEMQKTSGKMNTKGTIAYVSQAAWIQSMSIKDNVLFGNKFDKDLYEKVIQACELKADLELLPAGDRTEIGDKGKNLSGGQKQRIALARAAYNDSDIYLLDDPLSAVDFHVAKNIFDKLIGPEGILNKKTRVFVTHSLAFLPQVDNIVVMKNGEISELDTLNGLLEKKGAFADFLNQHLLLAVKEDIEDEELNEMKQNLENLANNKTEQAKSSISVDKFRKLSLISQRSLRRMSKEKEVKQKIGENLIEAEKTESGSVKWEVYSYYLKSVGWGIVVLAVIFNVLTRVLMTSSQVYLTQWGKQNKTRQNATSSEGSSQEMGLAIYSVLVFGQGIAMYATVLISAKGMIKASKKLFDVVMKRIMRCPMMFFDKTPIGRVLNRLVNDVYIIDSTIPRNFRYWKALLIAVASVFIVLIGAIPMIITVMIPLAIIYYFILVFYVKTSRQLKRLESASKSPLNSHFGESITGSLIIRAYKAEKRFIEESEKRIDASQTNFYASQIANRWIKMLLEILGSFIIFSSTVFAVFGRGSLSEGAVGLALTYALQITQFVTWFVVDTSELETNIVAVERVKEYSEETPQEAAWEIKEKDPPNEWPWTGCIEFRDFTLCYREGLDPSLSKLNFVVQSGEKIGIVGRTGAGKSSLTLSLFRIVETTSGAIFIDGIDISTIGLHALRSKITIIPQDPVLFSGTLRFNLDPFDEYNDEEIWKAVSLAHLKTYVGNLPGKISYEISEDGENLSIGQRQLICLARALLKKTRILILDEATGAVDLETDDLIQKTIRLEFKDCTVLTIAHRINTIMDADRVVVLDKGRIVEFDQPGKLIQNPTSMFYYMAKDMGLIS